MRVLLSVRSMPGKPAPGDAEGELLDQRSEDEAAEKDQRDCPDRQAAGTPLLSSAARPAAVESSIPANMTKMWGMITGRHGDP